MTWINATVFFPTGKLINSDGTPNAANIATYRSRYTDPVTGHDLVFADQSSDSDQPFNSRKLRGGSLTDGTVVPSPHYTSTPPQNATPTELAALRDGDTVTGGFPDVFLNAIAVTPQTDPLLIGLVVTLL